VCFATLLTGPSGVPDAQLSRQSLPSKPDRPQKMCTPSGEAIRAAKGVLKFICGYSDIQFQILSLMSFNLYPYFGVRVRAVPRD